MREKLIELLEKSPYLECLFGYLDYEKAADNLIANGVTIDKDNNVPSKWIPVTERLPEVDETVLVRDRVTGEVTTAHLNEFNSFVFRDGRGHGASYWMPLPEPPKGE